MADTPEDQIRSVLHDAFSSIRGDALSRQVATITLEDCIQAQIDSLESGAERPLKDGAGQQVSTRPSRYDRLKNLERQINELE